jgi:hypothetical protein
MLIRYRFIIKAKVKWHFDMYCILGILPVYIGVIKEG